MDKVTFHVNNLTIVPADIKNQNAGGQLKDHYDMEDIDVVELILLAFTGKFLSTTTFESLGSAIVSIELLHEAEE